MAKISETINPVKVAPLSQDDPKSPPPPSDSYSRIRRKSIVTRKHASVLQMSKAEFDAFKEKYGNDDGKLDKYHLEKAARHLNKVVGNEILSISGDEVVLKLAQRVEQRQSNRSGYCQCVYFLLILCMYLLILSMQSGGEQAFEQYSSLQVSINDQNPLVIQEKQEVYTWLRDKLVNRVFVDPPCGDGVCENKGNDFPAVDRFGCSNDCGMFNRTTDIMFNFTAEFDKKGVNNMGFNICPQGAKDTSRCIFRKYMNDVQAKGVVTESVTANAQTVMFGGKQVPKLGWGWKGDPYAFFEDNFSVPLVDGDYVIRFENNQGQGGLGVTTSYNYTRSIVGYQLAWNKVLICAESLNEKVNKSKSRRLTVDVVEANGGKPSDTYKFPSTTPYNDPCADSASNDTSLSNGTTTNQTKCYKYCLNNEDSCLRFKTNDDIVLMYPTFQKACQEFNVLSKFSRTRACTMSSLRSGFRRIEIKVLLDIAETEHGLKIAKDPLVSTQDQEKYFLQFSLEGLEKTLTDIGCKSVLPLGSKDYFVREYPSSFNITTLGETVLVVSPRCEDLSTLCKSTNGAWDMENRRCVCKPNKYGPNCDSVCPITNGITCNGRGTCDKHLKICNCNKGFAPPYCQETFKCTEDAHCGGTDAVDAPNADCNGDGFPSAWGGCNDDGECLAPGSKQLELWNNKRGNYFSALETAFGDKSPLCVAGMCMKCFPGWGGENCEYGGGGPNTLCQSQVNAGNAFNCNGACLCKEGRSGPNCENVVSTTSSSSSSSSAKRGSCNVTLGECECTADYSGVKCSFPQCGKNTCEGCYDKRSCEAENHLSTCIWHGVKNACETFEMPDANDGNKSDDNSNDGNENSQEELGKPCTGDAKCKSDYCDPNKSICATRPQAPSPSSNDEIECKKDDDCPHGDTCDLQTKQCVNDEDECATDSDCQSGKCDLDTLSCAAPSAATPLKANGEACTSAAECVSEKCDAGKCKAGRRRHRVLLDNVVNYGGGTTTTASRTTYTTCSTRPDHSSTFKHYLEVNFTVSRFSDLKPEEKTPFPPDDTSLDRFFGRNNVIIAGILVDQERYQVEECIVNEDTLFGDLDPTVVKNRRSMYTNKCVGGEEKAPYGADGVFIPGSAIYDQSVANSARFTNQLYPEGAPGSVETVIDEVFSEGGKPFAFHADSNGRYPVFMDINCNSPRAQNIIKYMESGYFIDFQTKLVDVKFMTYNGNTGFFGLVQITFEFQQDGKVAVSPKIRIVDVETYRNTSQVGFRFFLEVVFALAMLFEFIWELAELVQARIHRGSFLLYFKSLWNYIDVLTIVMQFVQIAMWMDLNANYTISFAPQRRYTVYESLTSNARYLYTGENVSSLASSPGLAMLRTEMKTLEQIADLRENIRRFSVLCIVLNVLRMLKLLDFQPRLGLVTRTIERAKNDLFHFVLIFALINTVYAVCGVVIFGEISSSFSTISKSMETVILLFMQGNIETIHYEMRESSMKNVWQFYFFTFVLINVFIMLNILLAILVDAYIEVRSAAEFSPGIVEEMASLVQASIKSKKSMSDKELGRMIEKMAWSNHRERKATPNKVEKKKMGVCGKIMTKKAMALPLSIVDEATEEVARHIPVVKSDGTHPVEYHIDTTFLERLLRNGLKGMVRPKDEEATFQRMKAALLDRYGKDVTVSGGSNGEELDIQTECILELLNTLKQRNNFSPGGGQ